MGSDARDEGLSPAHPSGGPLRHFRVDRRAMLQVLAAGVGTAAIASQASAAGHAHGKARSADGAGAAGPEKAGLAFLEQHAFDTLGLLSEQIVPGSRAAGVPDLLDRLLAVESTDTQRRFMQALGAFERAAREAQGRPWKSLTGAQATGLLRRVSGMPEGDPARMAFESLKRAVAETYYSTEAGMKELGWVGNLVFTPPASCSA